LDKSPAGHHHRWLAKTTGIIGEKTFAVAFIQLPKAGQSCPMNGVSGSQPNPVARVGLKLTSPIQVELLLITHVTLAPPEELSQIGPCVDAISHRLKQIRNSTIDTFDVPHDEGWTAIEVDQLAPSFQAACHITDPSIWL